MNKEKEPTTAKNNDVIEESADVQTVIGTPDADEIQENDSFNDMTPEEISEFANLEDPGMRERAVAHRKKCKKDNRRPIPPSRWLKCPMPGCDYKAPESLVNHLRSHGGVNEVAKVLGVLPEQIVVLNPELQQRFTDIGRHNMPKKAS